MKKVKLPLLITITLLLIPAAVSAQGQVKVRQEHYDHYDEKNDWTDNIPGRKDWVVLFAYPKDARDVKVTASGNKENEVLRKSDINYEFWINGKRYVKVLTGRGARDGYNGDRDSWARSLRLEYYAPFRPRG